MFERKDVFLLLISALKTIISISVRYTFFFLDQKTQPVKKILKGIHFVISTIHCHCSLRLKYVSLPQSSYLSIDWMNHHKVRTKMNRISALFYECACVWVGRTEEEVTRKHTLQQYFHSITKDFRLNCFCSILISAVTSVLIIQ